MPQPPLYQAQAQAGGGTPTSITQGGGTVSVDADGDILTTPAAGKTFALPLAPVANANRALLELGSGVFGGGAGTFAGSASGTVIGVNAASGYAGLLLDLQIEGARK